MAHDVLLSMSPALVGGVKAPRLAGGFNLWARPWGPFPHARKALAMTEKTASVHWEGSGQQSQGQISTETGALERYPWVSAAASGTIGA